jgi:hypothetical protein
MDLGHQALAALPDLFALIAAKTLGGDKGKLRIRAPVAPATAAAIAGKGGVMPVSPTPRTP